MTAVSVLLPVYNASRYLGGAVESILRQTHREFELLILDDGSRDDSLAQLRRFEQRDSRVRVVSRPNTGHRRCSQRPRRFGEGRMAVSHGRRRCRSTRTLRETARLPSPRIQIASLSVRELCSWIPMGLPLVEFVDCFDHADIERTLMRPAIGILHPTVAMSRSAVLSVGGYRADYPHAKIWICSCAWEK